METSLGGKWNARHKTFLVYGVFLPLEDSIFFCIGLLSPLTKNPSYTLQKLSWVSVELCVCVQFIICRILMASLFGLHFGEKERFRFVH